MSTFGGLGDDLPLLARRDEEVALVYLVGFGQEALGASGEDIHCDADLQLQPFVSLLID